MTKPLEMLLVPRVTSKSDRLWRQLNTYTLLVPASATKAAIKAQIETGQSVEVVGIRSLNQKGKTYRSYQLNRHSRRHRTRLSGKRPDFKKVYITLKAGQELSGFTELAGTQTPDNN